MKIVRNPVLKLISTASVCVFILVSCMTKPELVVGHIKDAIQLNIKAAPDLNYYDGQAHSLHMVIYELADISKFRSIISNRKNRIRLLEGDWNDKSVKSVHEFSFQPSEFRKITIDRITDGRYLAVVTGYFNANKIERQIKLYSVDVYSENTWWTQSRLKQLLVQITLGKHGVEIL